MCGVPVFAEACVFCGEQRQPAGRFGSTSSSSLPACLPPQSAQSTASSATGCRNIPMKPDSSEVSVTVLSTKLLWGPPHLYRRAPRTLLTSLSGLKRESPACSRLEAETGWRPGDPHSYLMLHVSQLAAAKTGLTGTQRLLAYEFNASNIFHVKVTRRFLTILL